MDYIGYKKRIADIFDRMNKSDMDLWEGKSLFLITSSYMYTGNYIAEVDSSSGRLNLDNSDGFYAHNSDSLSTSDAIYYGQDDEYVYFSKIELRGRICYVHNELYGKILSIENGIMSFIDDNVSFKNLISHKIRNVALHTNNSVYFS